MRKCIDCFKVATEDTLKDFAYSSVSKYKRRNLCKNCLYKRGKKYREENEEKVRDWKTKHQLQKRYKVDRETYDKCMSTSDRCEICGDKENLCYDHCHETMEFRGVLCRKCNSCLGALGDNLESINKVVKYLSKSIDKD